MDERIGRAEMFLESGERNGDHLSSRVSDLSASAALLRTRDLGSLGHGRRTSVDVSWAFGVALGASYMDQTLDDGSRRASVSPFASPLVLADLTFGRRLFVRAEVGAPLYALRVERGGGTETSWRAALATALGAGTSF